MKGNILIIDDNPIDLKVATLTIEKQGFTTHAFTDYQQALVWVDQYEPQMIFLDLLMPQVSGYDVIQMFRQKAQTSFVPIIIISGKNQVEDVKKAISLGANDYIVKPLDPLIIQEKLHKVDMNQKEDYFSIDLPPGPQSQALFSQPMQILSISEFGITVISQTALLPGETTMVTDMNKAIFGSDRLYLRCLSCDPLRTQTGYSMQLTFIGMSESQRQNLRKVCRQMWVDLKDRKM